MDFDEINQPSPCCSCLHRTKHASNKGGLENKFGQHATRNGLAHHSEANGAGSCISSCHSIGSGWFSPETGVVVVSPTEIHRVTDQYNLQVQNPFLINVEGYSDERPTIISAGHLLRKMQMGEKEYITENVPGKLLEEHNNDNYFGSMDCLKFLESGGTFYSFTCRTYMTPYEIKMVKAIANLSCFEDETRDNFVPGLNCDDPDDINQYTFVLQKAAYVLPGVRLSDVTPEVLSSNNYHECCQPVNGTKIWDHKEEHVFRFTRPIIPHIYRMTIQFRVSEVVGTDLNNLASVFGVHVDKAILMERTKRSVPPKVDATAKAKSVLCYTAIPGGLLVTHATVILNTSIPTLVAKVIHTFGGMGLAETCETAERTRQFFFKMRS